MTTQPLVSVIVPAHNAELTLGETLSSIAAQRYQPIEIVVVDDGSIDATVEIAAAFCERDKRARLVRQSNLGVAAARNAGIAVSSGAFVAPIDADDIWHPDYLARLVAKATTMRPAPGFVYAWFRRIDASGDIIHSGAATTVQGFALQRLAFRNVVGNGSGLLIARAALAETGGYDTRLRAAGFEGSEDVLLQLLIAARHPIASVPAYLVGYRSLSGSMGSDNARMFASKRLALQLYAERFRDRPLLRRSWRWLRARRALILAYQAFRRQSISAALGHAATGLLLDPRGTVAIVRDYGFSRARAREAESTRTNFADAEPHVAIAGYDTASRWSASLALDELRFRSLAACDARSAAARDEQQL